MTASSLHHLEKLDSQIQDFFFDCLELFERFVPRGKAERWAWLATAEAFMEATACQK